MAGFGPHRYGRLLCGLAKRLYKKLSSEADDCRFKLWSGTYAQKPCGRITMLTPCRFNGGLAPYPWAARGRGLVWPNPAVGWRHRATGIAKSSGRGFDPAGAADPTPNPKPCVQAGSAARGADGLFVHASNLRPYRQAPRPAADDPLWQSKGPQRL